MTGAFCDSGQREDGSDASGDAARIGMREKRDRGKFREKQKQEHEVI